MDKEPQLDTQYMHCPRVGKITFFPARGSDYRAMEDGKYAVPGQRQRKVGTRIVYEQVFWTIDEIRAYSDRTQRPMDWVKEPLWQ